ncbi:hypothetical protein [Pseudalkalibacillus decolorationis]|uniref:hypothetical protein n=1 Tax=Pseudalkalibacillus decolorationis TaxID=163879 RepID=UPI0021480BCB|nr:hypothetical protein [Pseudalkalibacillus decolorationis]
MPDKGPQYEGKEEAYMDVDRMINEGMAGGTVTGKYDHEQIEQSLDLVEEDPPVVITEKDQKKNRNNRHQG